MYGMERLRIAHLITELGPGGAERCVYELSRRMDPARFDVQVVALRGGAVADWLAEAGIRTTVLGLRGRWDLMKLRPLVELLGRERVDLLHTHLFHADLAGRVAARLAGVRHLVHTVHTAEGRFRPWQFAHARFWAGGCDRIVCVSQSAATYHARRSGLPAWRYTVIPNGVDAEQLRPDPAARARVRTQLGIGNEEPLAAFVGRLDYEKGLDTLVSAMSHLAARGHPAHLVIAGDGPRRHIVENFISHGEGGAFCRWLGFVRDVRSVLSAADFFVMPSRWEGFGLAAAEAMAASLPVVATRVPGLSDLVTDGETGVLVGPEDNVALAEAIELLVGSAELRRRMGRRGREVVAQRFPIRATIEAHERLYLELVGNTPAKTESPSKTL